MTEPLGDDPGPTPQVWATTSRGLLVQVGPTVHELPRDDLARAYRRGVLVDPIEVDQVLEESVDGKATP